MPKKNVECSQCGNKLKRYEINAITKKPIKNFFCNKKCKGQWQKHQRELLGYTKEWIINEYITLGKSANQIAREIGRDSKRVWEWIHDYGIPTRSRGHDTSHLPKDGSSFKGKTHSKKTKEKIRQARLNDGHVPYLKNGEHWLKSVTKEKHPAYKGGLTPERQAFYSSEEWSNAVKSVWHRDNAICQKCGKHHNTEKNRGNFHIHHIVSFMVRELRSDINNLVLLCKECHRWVHSKENINQEFIKVTK